jgi:hypothetical protein
MSMSFVRSKEHMLSSFRLCNRSTDQYKDCRDEERGSRHHELMMGAHGRRKVYSANRDTIITSW